MARRQIGERIRSHAARLKRRMLWSLFVLLAVTLALPIADYVYTGGPSAQAAAEKQTNPRANYWRAVRTGNEGYTAASGPYTTNVLIQNGGSNWRQWRNGPVANIMPWFLAVVVLALAALYLYRGQIRLERKPSGKMMERYNVAERTLHWYTAILFIILAITGLTTLFGRAVLIPVLGLAGNAAWSSFSRLLHDYLGPFFIIGIVLMIIVWMKDNIPNKTDWEWLKQGLGGILAKGKHPHAGRFNAGEKIFVFWLGVIILGIITSVTGVILDFPILGQTRETMQVSNVIHAVGGILWLGIVLGHIYLGLTTQGALEGMWKGKVSEEWARQHHDLWYNEVGKKG